MATKTKTTAAKRLNGDLSTLKETKEPERLKIEIAKFETQVSNLEG